jgi:hypothetical protein
VLTVTIPAAIVITLSVKMANVVAGTLDHVIRVSVQERNRTAHFPTPPNIHHDSALQQKAP